MTRWYINLKYRYKLLLTYLVLSVVPLAVLGTFAYVTSVNNATRETVSSLEQSLKQAASNVAYKVRAVAGAADTLVRSQRIQQILSRAASGYPERSEEIDDYYLLSDLLQSIEDYDYVLNARIYIRPEVLYSRENLNIFHVSQLVPQSILESERSVSLWRLGEFEYEYYEGPAKSLCLTRTIPDLGSPEPHLAVLQVECRIAILDDALRQFARYSGATTIAHDDRGVVSGRSAGGVSLEEAADIVLRAADRSALVVSADMSDLPWRLSAVVPVAEVTASARAVTRFTIGLAILLIAADVPAAFYFARMNTRRLDSLLLGLRNVTAGHYRRMVPVVGCDEIGQLQRQFNTMAAAVNSLVAQVKDATDQRREAEFKALESQINPHFLYNTLENIKWMAMRRNAPDIVSTVESLSNLYRFTLNRGKEIVTLREEVDSVREYIAIQNLRFGNRLHTEVNIPPDLADCTMTKMVLQPLVENAIYHGIHAKDGRRGTIRIDAQAPDGAVVVKVADDGVGMEKSELDGVLEADSEGYGVKNVHQRLQLYYGPEYGLSYRSTPGAGTTVSVRFPRQP